MMKHSICATLFCVILVGGGAYAASPAPSAQRQVESIMKEMGKAAKAHDTNRFMAAFWHSARLVFVLNGHIIHGWGALHAQQLKWWRNGKTKAVYTPNGKPGFMQVDPTTAITTLPLAKHSSPAKDAVVLGTLVATDVWEKLPRGWRIVYGHESWEH